jgi:hypothetical protein
MRTQFRGWLATAATALGIATIVCSAITVCSQVAAQEARYDGTQAGLDAYRLGEEQRRAKVGMQLDVNDQVKAWAGLPTSRGETIYYGLGGGYAPGYGSGPLFGPWPYLPGDIYGYRYFPPTRQPIGQQQIQTGPNRWESRPVYATPITPYRPLPSVASPLLDNTPYAVPRPATGPREF